MPELLLELLSEEIPARMQDRARADLERLVTDGLKEAGLEYSGVWAFSTPRRIGLSVGDLPWQQPNVRQVRRGPRVGSPDKAIDGFLRSVGFDSIAQCEIRELKGGQYHIAVIKREGAATADALGGIVKDAIRAMGWPKSMRWGDSAFQWVRPLQNILCIFDGRPVSGSLDIGSGQALAFNDRTVGHRFLAPAEIAITSAADYRAKLEEAFVLVDPAERRDRIEEHAKSVANGLGHILREDRALLNEVTGLVEWPVAVAGTIDPGFITALPPEVLIASMRRHQRFFALESAAGRMVPHFITIADMETGDGGKSVAAGNERVLRARLADANFFWHQDSETELAARVEALEDITFHARLGTVREKVRRIEKLAGELAPLVGANPEQAKRAAHLAKADLTTGMVGEFPELQGVMGRDYAIVFDEEMSVADAIRDHYAPQGPSDTCPSDPVTVTVALADKIDTLAAFWFIDETPTGSRDPYALRRAALGIVRLVLENRLSLRLRELLDLAVESAAHSNQHVEKTLLRGKKRAKTTASAFGFIVDRLKVHLRDRGLRHDLVDAVFAKGDEDNLLQLRDRAEVLAEFLGSDDGENLLTAYRRATNILRIEEKKEDRRFNGSVDTNSLKMKEEQDLFRSLTEEKLTRPPDSEPPDSTTLHRQLLALADLRGPVDRFFDTVKVNDEDPARRENRLNLLSYFRAVMDSVADFSRIEG